MKPVGLVTARIAGTSCRKMKVEAQRTEDLPFVLRRSLLLICMVLDIRDQLFNCQKPGDAAYCIYRAIYLAPMLALPRATTSPRKLRL